MTDLKVSTAKPIAFKSRVEFVSKEAQEYAPKIRKLINHIKHHTESNKYTYFVNASDDFLAVDTLLYEEKTVNGINSYYRGVSQVGGTKESQVSYILKHIKTLKEAREAYEFKIALANDKNAPIAKKNSQNKILKFIKSLFKNW